MSSRLAILFVGGLLGCAATGTSAAQDRPNILFILADDVGQEVLGCYGGESYRTPHLDRLARTGIRFDHCYSMPTCHPSRLALLTGKYPFRFGRVPWGSFPKAEEKTTFAQVLRRAGYATMIAGKWQLTLLGDDPRHPHRLGFEEFDLFGWHEGPRYYDPMIYRNGVVRDDTKGRYGPDLYVESLIDFMERKRSQPFLAYYSMALCHEVTDDLKEPVPHGPHGRYDSYVEMVEAMDRCVGRLIGALDRLKLREKTLVLFVGDNGTPIELIVRAENGKLIKEPVVSRQDGRDVPGGKSKLTDGGTRVPLIANWPASIRKGVTANDLVDFSDFLPTFADLAGAPLPEHRRLDGTSFASRLRGKGPGPRSWAYAEESVLPLPGGVEPSGENSGMKWVRTQRWKLYTGGRLFDMESDRGEASPILRRADSPEAARNRRILQAALSALTPKPGR